MLIRHAAYYLLARGVPGLVNFAALAVYTRLLAPDEFGRYALVLAGVGLANAVVFQWLRLVLLRFLHAQGDDTQAFLAGIFALFLTLALAVTGVGSLLALWWPDSVWQRLLALAVPLLLTQAWFELGLELLRARLAPLPYGKLLGSKAVIALSIGALLAWIGLGALAPLLGLIAGHALAFLLFGLAAWKGVRPAWPAASQLREQLRYGLPLTVTFALAWVVSGSDRFMLAWFLDEAAVGAYAAAYDLVFPAITLLLSVIHTAAYPLVVHGLENKGADVAEAELRINGELISAVSLAAAAMLIVLGPLLVSLIIGSTFREDALRILPWIALASAFAGIKAYYFDIAFHLGRSGGWLVITGGVAAGINFILNLFLIPLSGIVGAALATLFAYSIAMCFSAWFGAKVFPMPALMLMLLKAMLVGLVSGMAAALGSAGTGASWINLSIGLAFAILSAVFVSTALNVGGIRYPVMRVFHTVLPGRTNAQKDGHNGTR